MAAFYQKTKLLKGLLTGDIARTGPFYVKIDITNRCNLRCVGCQYHSPMLNMPSLGDQTIKDMPFNLFEKLCNELKIMGTKSLLFVGEGENFLHPRLFDMVSMAKAAGFQLTIFTNGTFLDETIIHSLIDFRLDILIVSLWASSLQIYEQNYPGTNPANFRRVVDGLKLLKEIKAEKKIKLPHVVLHHPINHHNFQGVDKMVDLACITGCNFLSFTPLRTRRGKLSSLSLNKHEEEFLFYSFNRIRKRLNSLSINHNINQTLMRYRIGEVVLQKLPCYIAWHHARVKMDGTVIPCDSCDLPMGNLKEKNFHDIWNGSDYRTFRRITLTSKGLVSVGKYCDCGSCCHVEENMRFHRLLGWLLFLLVDPIIGKTRFKAYSYNKGFCATKNKRNVCKKL